MKTWLVTESDLDRIALGAGILGTGGGGNAYLGKLRARERLRAGQRIEIMLPSDLHDDDHIISVGAIGAPTVGIEKIEQGAEGCRAVRAIEAATGKRATALFTDEIGGANALEPMIAAAQLGLPIVDADGMGRAFPELQMNTFFIYGATSTPGVLADEHGATVVYQNVATARRLEKLVRAGTIAMGCSASFALPPFSGAQIKRHGIRHSVSHAWRLGDAVIGARVAKRDPVGEILHREAGRILFQGKIVDVHRWTNAGFARGTVSFDGLGAFASSRLQIEIQNENLIAQLDGEVVATVPDLICIVDAETARPISTEEIRYGMRVAVIGLPASPLLRSMEALAVIGPRAFGYDFDYQPIGSYVEPQPVEMYRDLAVA